MRRVRPYRLALEIGLVALVGGLAALGVSTGLWASLDDVPATANAPTAGPSPPPLGPLAAYEPIATRDLFNPGDRPSAPTRSGLRLWGVGMHGGEARAVIEDAGSHRQELYRVGDDVGGARITAIEWNRVTLARAGAEETLEIATTPADAASDDPPAAVDGARERPAPPPGIRRTGTNGFIVDRRELAGAIDNMSGLLTQLRAVAEIADGRPAGFRLFQIRDDSLFRRLGIENGDVVQRVNGTAIGDPAALLAFLAKLRSEPRVALDIVREGQSRTLVYDLR